MTMPRPNFRRVTIDFDVGSDPIAGEIGESDGQTHPFSGWLGLAGALEHVLELHGQPPEQPQPAEDS